MQSSFIARELEILYSQAFLQTCSVRLRLMRLIDDAKVPLVLLLFAAETVLTTLTCVADYTSWDNVTLEVKRGLNGLYLPYLGLGMGVMFLRVFRILI